MPRRATLKVVTRKGTPTLYVRGTVRGIPVFESAGTSDPALAEEFCSSLAARLFREAVHGPAPEKPRDGTFLQAVASYLEVEERSDNTKDYVGRLVKHFGDCPLSSFSGKKQLEDAYKAILVQNAKGATKLRQVLTPLRAILTHAAEMEMISVVPVFKSPKIKKPETEYLKPEAVIALIRAASRELRPMLTFAAGTGARPAEYLDLDWTDIDLRGKRARLVLKGEDEGRKIRRCDLPPVVMAALESLPHRTGPVFQTLKGTRYYDTGRSSGGQFSTAWAGACRRAGLPGVVRVYERKDRKKGPNYKRFAPHHTPYVLRHSWATWHHCINKNLVQLQHDGGWESPDMLNVYVKLMPDAYRQEAVDFLEGRVDLHFNAPSVDNRFRAIAVHSGRTTPLGRPKSAKNGGKGGAAGGD